jgi:two-component sensor histidine kinase
MEQGSDSIQSYEHRMARSAGEPRDVLFTKACFRDSSGAVAGIVGTFIDITERKQAEQRVLASLHEKEVLLKEIHHRVKNNLQVISSLMNLQCTHVQDPTTVAMFQDCQARIRSMALVHEELYGSEDLARVDMAIYVRKLSGKLFSIFQGARDIERRLSVDNLALPIVTAVPCGLILNELLTNALKHAFQDRERGTVSVAMVKVAHIVTLTVEDDGVGIPPDLDLSAPATFGLRLVVNLVEQLGGSMDLDTAGGTRFLIRFESKD